MVRRLKMLMGMDINPRPKHMAQACLGIDICYGEYLIAVISKCQGCNHLLEEVVQIGSFNSSELYRNLDFFRALYSLNQKYHILMSVVDGSCAYARHIDDAISGEVLKLRSTRHLKQSIREATFQAHWEGNLISVSECRHYLPTENADDTQVRDQIHTVCLAYHAWEKHNETSSPCLGVQRNQGITTV